MIPYSRGLIIDNGNNFGIVKTETVFGFGQRNANNFLDVNESRAYDWLISTDSLEKNTIQAPETARSFQDVTSTTKPESRQASKKKSKKIKNKKSKREEKKVNKCVFKIMKDQNKQKRRKNKRGGVQSMKKKFLVPLILGLLAAKSVLIPIALKALAFMSAKGFLMGFFSTILASFLSLKGMFDHNHRYQDRKDEKTQVEIIQVPVKDEHYYDDHYKRLDYIPMQIGSQGLNIPNNHVT